MWSITYHCLRGEDACIATSFRRSDMLPRPFSGMYDIIRVSKLGDYWRLIRNAPDAETPRLPLESPSASSLSTPDNRLRAMLSRLFLACSSTPLSPLYPPAACDQYVFTFHPCFQMLTLLLWVLWASTEACVEPPSPSHPNIVILMVDDMGAFVRLAHL